MYIPLLQNVTNLMKIKETSKNTGGPAVGGDGNTAKQVDFTHISENVFLFVSVFSSISSHPIYIGYMCG